MVSWCDEEGGEEGKRARNGGRRLASLHVVLRNSLLS